MARSILLVNGHPDPSKDKFCHALCDAYQEGAHEGGNMVARVDIGALKFGFLENAVEFTQSPPEDIAAVQAMLERADHMVLVHPLWLGTLPARTKAFLEHLARNDFLVKTEVKGMWPAKRMRGKSARIVMTMGMPSLAYQIFFRAHSLKALEAGVFQMAGFGPVRHTLFGAVDLSQEGRQRMLAKMRTLGRAGK
ncbi:MAG: NAD(P)H-dependent oxidoreductase [Oceanicaulis sp.]|uniref:NAD(P)H-dependent oxidoreductase n=1 Tax=Glycocaulis sp. TaxID=1969725 RepID=UPI0025BE99C0|nr:NAD(P)H-dependent oxidoreductase [Glycocaulis sp.]MCC5980240.1 NAD(P)H-dependent oxidoreductase [Oceanicaulis sp.]MCH8522589.1 NAD(P)H-dependent oxidoreductase [Glycocaulis sp.]